MSAVRASGNAMIRLIGPGGAGKSTIGALLAERLDVPFLDLDRYFAARLGDISEYNSRHGYDAYARENIGPVPAKTAGQTTL
jgi:shikimate kinase